MKDGSVINFWEANFIPKWYHLLYAKGDLKEILIEKFAEEDADRIVNYIYESTYLNRLFFKDYINIEKLTRDVVIELIEKIEVHEDGGLDIYYRFRNPFQVAN